MIVRETLDGGFELIAGERRLRAAKIAGLEKVPAIVRTASAKTMLELALIENLQREDISAIECAEAYRRLSMEFGVTQEEIAARVGKSRAAVANAIRLLGLPEPILEALREGAISEGHGRALLAISPQSRQLRAFRQIVEQGLSVRNVETMSHVAARGRTRSRLREADLAALEEALSQALGAPSRIVRNGRRGRMEVQFFDDEDLGRILEVLGVRL